MNTKETIRNMMLENTGIALGDSGGAYGRHWQINNDNGINTDELSPIDFYLDEKNKTIHLEQTVNIYDFLTKHLDKSSTAETIEEILYKVCNQEDISVYSIWEIEALFNNDFLGQYVYDNYYDETTNDYTEDYFLEEIPYELSPSSYFKGYEWINTYNGEQFVSQTLQFMCFTDGYNDYVLLQIHGGCDVRGGYTKPRVFQIEDIDYFLMYMDCMETCCDCGLNDLFLQGYDEISDKNGDWLDDTDIYNQCYVDKEGNLRCRECNSIIMEYSPDF